MGKIIFEDLPSTNSPINAENLNNNFDLTHPIGTILITETNNNPSSYLGGTWTLIDKEFSNTYGSNADTYWIPNDNATINSIYVIRSGHTLQIGITLTANVDISDVTVALGTLNFEELGITNTIFSRQALGYADTGNVVVGTHLHYTSGVLQTYDIFPNGTLESGTAFAVNIDLVTSRNFMLDDKCNKFYWRRTA